MAVQMIEQEDMILAHLNRLPMAWEMVTPTLAQAYLERNIPDNRKISKDVVARYAADMRDGNWQPCPDAVVINADGFLTNGQHRLRAIVECGISEPLLVIRNWPVDAIYGLDQGRMRTMGQALHMIYHAKVDNYEIGILNCLWRLQVGGTGRPALAAFETMRAAHGETARWVASQFPTHKRGLSSTAMMAAITAASYHVDRERLADFCKVIHTGMPTSDNDSAAQKLREQLLTMRNQGGADQQKEIYQRTENAVRHFCKFTALKTLKIADEELFPLPKPT